MKTPRKREDERRTYYSRLSPRSIEGRPQKSHSFLPRRREDTKFVGSHHSYLSRQLACCRCTALIETESATPVRSSRVKAVKIDLRAASYLRTACVVPCFPKRDLARQQPVDSSSAAPRMRAEGTGVVLRKASLAYASRLGSIIACLRGAARMELHLQSRQSLVKLSFLFDSYRSFFRIYGGQSHGSIRHTLHRPVGRPSL